jgi:hypothetical protein
MGIWEPWFYLGAILFSASTWRAMRAGHRNTRPLDHQRLVRTSRKS